MDAPDVDPAAARLLRKLRRMNARSEAARAAATAALESREAHLQRVAVYAEQAVRTLGASGVVSDSLVAARDSRDAACAELARVQSALAPDAATAAASRALDATRSAPASPRMEDDEERRQTAHANAVRAALLTTRGGLPAHFATHEEGWRGGRPSRWLIERVPAGTGAANLSLIPRTHDDATVRSGPWLPAARAGERTEARAHLRDAIAGTWRGHGGLDADALAGGLTSTRRALGVTTASATRFAHEPIASHTRPPGDFVKTQEPVPQSLLGTLTHGQARAPRHPAYLLDSRVKHSTGWRVGASYPAGGAPTFSDPPATRAPTVNDQRRARNAMIPDRSLALSDPVHAGKPGYYTDVHPPALFSKIALDYQWIREADAEAAREREGRFWLAAREAEKPYVRDDSAAAPATLDDDGAGAHAEAPSYETFRSAGSRAAARAPAETLLASGLIRRAGPTGKAHYRSFSASSRSAYRTSVLGPPETVALGGSGTRGGGARALTLLRGPQGRFAPMRSALVFDAADSAVDYETARAAITARNPMGAKVFDAAHAKSQRALVALEDELARRGVNTGLGTTGRGSVAAAMRVRDVELARQSLEPPCY